MGKKFFYVGVDVFAFLKEVQEAVTRSVKTVLEECPSLRTLRAATESAGDSPYRKCATATEVC